MTASTDVYSLGVILYELLVGQPPFVGENEVILLLRHVEETERPIRERVGSASPDLAALVHSMLRKLLIERPTMAEVERRMRALLDSQVALHRVPASLPRPVKSAEPVQTQPHDAQRHRWLLAVIAGILTLLVTGLWLVHSIRHEQQSMSRINATPFRMDEKEPLASPELKTTSRRSAPEDQHQAETLKVPTAPKLLASKPTSQPARQPPGPVTAKKGRVSRVPPERKVSDAPKPHIELIRD